MSLSVQSSGKDSMRRIVDSFRGLIFHFFRRLLAPHGTVFRLCVMLHLFFEYACLMRPTIYSKWSSSCTVMVVPDEFRRVNFFGSFSVRGVVPSQIFKWSS